MWVLVSQPHVCYVFLFHDLWILLPNQWCDVMRIWVSQPKAWWYMDFGFPTRCGVIWTWVSQPNVIHMDLGFPTQCYLLYEFWFSQPNVIHIDLGSPTQCYLLYEFWFSQPCHVRFWFPNHMSCEILVSHPYVMWDFSFPEFPNHMSCEILVSQPYVMWDCILFPHEFPNHMSCEILVSQPYVIFWFPNHMSREILVSQPHIIEISQPNMSDQKRFELSSALNFQYSSSWHILQFKITFLFQHWPNFPPPGLEDARLSVPEDAGHGQAAVVSEGAVESLQRQGATNCLEHVWNMTHGNIIADHVYIKSSFKRQLINCSLNDIWFPCFVQRNKQNCWTRWWQTGCTCVPGSHDMSVSIHFVPGVSVAW